MKASIDRQLNERFSAAREEIKRRLADHKERGVPYPVTTVPEFDPYTTVWYGPVPYHVVTYEKLRKPNARQNLPVPLPDGFVVDGSLRLPGETERQHEMYETWRDLGPQRHVRDAARKLGLACHPQALTTWKRLAKRFHWEERVAIHDSDLAARMQLALQREMDAAAREQAAKRTEFLTREVKIVDMVYLRLEEMLSLPATRKQVLTSTEASADGKRIINHYTIWEPAHWSYGDIARLVAEIDKIARLHYGMPTSNAQLKIDQTLSGTSGAQQAAPPPELDHMTPKQRQAHQYACRRADDEYARAYAECMARDDPVDRVVAVAAGG